MKGMGDEEDRVYRSGSIETSGMKVKVRETGETIHPKLFVLHD